MQHVNDDMDDIFRRAGKDYPLDTSGADWDKIAAGLQTSVVTPKKGDNRRYLFLLLLLPLPWLCMKYTGNNKGENIAVKENFAVKESGIHKDDKASQENKLQKKEEVLFKHSSSVGERLNNSLSFSNAENNLSTANNHGYANTEIRNSNVRSSQNNKAVSWKTIRKSRPGTYTLKDGTKVVKESDGIYTVKERDGSNISLVDVSGTKTDVVMPPVQNETKLTKETASANATVVVNEKHKQTHTDSSKIADQGLPATENNVAKEKTEKQRKERFYLAPIAGFSVTSIKGQKLSDPGMDYGILAGVKLSQRFCLEAGVLSTRKNYFSKGAYYDKSRIYMPANSKLTTVSGDCRMLEIPVAVRYDFKPAQRSHWFTTAGISNYLMKKENYSYTYYYYSTSYYATYHKTYDNSSRDWMSVLQLSGGFNHSLRNGFRLRIEPYAQLPLKGVGYGDLPLTSYGLRLGIEKGFRF